MGATENVTLARRRTAVPDGRRHEFRGSSADAWPAWRTLLFGLVCIEIATALGGLAMLLGVDRAQGASAFVLLAAGHALGQQLAGIEITPMGLAGALAIAPLAGLLILALLGIKQRAERAAVTSS
jgi:hypothetical protein